MAEALKRRGCRATPLRLGKVVWGRREGRKSIPLPPSVYAWYGRTEPATRWEGHSRSSVCRCTTYLWLHNKWPHLAALNSTHFSSHGFHESVLAQLSWVLTGLPSGWGQIATWRGRIPAARSGCGQNPLPCSCVAEDGFLLAGCCRLASALGGYPRA